MSDIYSSQNPYSSQPYPQQSSDGALDWNSTIEAESSFIVLPEGDYPFTIEKMERSRHNGSEKIPACPKAIVHFAVTAPDGKVVHVQENYLLHTKMEWKLSELFAAIGMKAKGEKAQMQWNNIIGKSGVCKLMINEYEDKNGNERENNKIDKLYPSYDQPLLSPPLQPQCAPPAQAYAQQPQPQYTPPAGNWQSGKF